jgi:hypothetical protein
MLHHVGTVRNDPDGKSDSQRNPALKDSDIGQHGRGGTLVAAERGRVGESRVIPRAYWHTEGAYGV